MKWNYFLLKLGLTGISEDEGILRYFQMKWNYLRMKGNYLWMK
jgi:hypothetical protein